MDDKTRALLGYAKKLTETPALLSDSDFDNLRQVGWDDEAIYDATALIAMFNFSGRLEAASGLPQDQIPASARMAEARKG